MDWDVVVVGGANSDYTVRASRLPMPGETIEGAVFHEGPGGKGANQAVAAARLGARVAFIGRLGGDARGEVLLGQLQAEGVDVRYVSRDPHTPTGVALIAVAEGGEKQIAAYPGANRTLGPAQLEAARPALTATRTLLLQLEVPLPTVHAAAAQAHEAGAQVVLDPAPARPLPRALLQWVHVIRPNAAEAATLTGVVVRDRPTARRAAQRLLEQGVGAVAVQAGDEGNLLVWRQGERWLPKLPVAAVDATGAGDAFAATLAVMLAEGRPLEEAGVVASAAAALATTALGAQAGLPRRDAVLTLLRAQQAAD